MHASTKLPKSAFPCLFDRHAEGIAELRGLELHVRILAVVLDSGLHAICQLLLHSVQGVHPAQRDKGAFESKCRE